ncbi:MAG: ABC-2 transporter permease [Peptococcaceae bacterium]|nr:ABC-2 transporter permease [Peptococcaceae bacterium]
MNGVIKMAWLDQRSFRQTLSVYGTLLLVLFMLSFAGLSLFVSGVTAAWLMALMLMGIFAVQEKNGLERLYATLALSDREVVAGRYLFMFVHYALALGLAMLLALFVSLVQGVAVDGAQVCAGVGASVFLFTLLVGIQTPIYFTVGYSKGMIAGLVAYVAVLLLAISTFFSDSTLSMLQNLAQHPVVLLFVSFMASALMLGFSYRFSLKNYRDFM